MEALLGVLLASPRGAHPSPLPRGEPRCRGWWRYGDNGSGPVGSLRSSQNEFSLPEPNAEKALNNCNKLDCSSVLVSSQELTSCSRLRNEAWEPATFPLLLSSLPALAEDGALHGPEGDGNSCRSLESHLETTRPCSNRREPN